MIGGGFVEGTGQGKEVGTDFQISIFGFWVLGFQVSDLEFQSDRDPLDKSGSG